MRDRLGGLRHHAVVGRHHQHHDVGDLGAARAHLAERGVARRVDEGHRMAGADVDLIGADVLGDAARLARRDVGIAQRIEQRGLAVVDVAHHGHHRRARLQILGPVLDALEADLDVGLADPLGLVAELAHDQLGGVGIEGLIDGRHDAHLHQLLDHVGAAHRHPVGELGHGDGLGQHHLAHEGPGVLQLLLAPLALAVALERRERRAAPLDHLAVAVQHQPAARGLALPDRRPAGLALVGAILALGRLGLALDRRARRVGGLGRGPGGGRRLAPGLGRRLRHDRPAIAAMALLLFLGEHPGGRVLGLPAGLFLGLLARLLLGLALEGGLLLGPPAGLVGGQAPRIVLGALAGLLLGLAGVDQRAHARGLLLVGQGLEHHRPPRLPAPGLGRRAHARRRLGRPADHARGAALGRAAERAGGAGLDVALALDLDRNRLAAAVREALPNHPGVDRLLQLEPSAGPRQPDARIAFLLFGIGHRDPVVSFGSADSIGPAAAGGAITPLRKPASRSTSCSSRRASPPGATATCTKLSRPRAAPNSALENAAINGRSGASRRSFCRPSAAPSLAATRTAAAPERNAARTCSKPTATCPARRASPSVESPRRTSRPSTCRSRSAEARAGARAALAKRFLATALFTTFRSALNQIPRPGSRASRSGSTRPSGSSTKRSNASRGRTARVTRQRRSTGPARSPMGRSASIGAVSGTQPRLVGPGLGRAGDLGRRLVRLIGRRLGGGLARRGTNGRARP